MRAATAPQVLLAAGFALNALLLWAFARGAGIALLRLGEAAQALLARRGWLRPVVAFFSGMAVGLAFEVLGLSTGLPFGQYRYEWPAPSVLGVPVPVVFGWGLYLLVSYLLALSALRGAAARVTYAGALMVCLDLAIDPVMTSRGLWVWARRGEWFGIPLENFAGWFLVSAVALLPAELAGGERREALEPLASVAAYLAAFLPLFAIAAPTVLPAALAGAALGGLLSAAAVAVSLRGAGVPRRAA